MKLGRLICESPAGGILLGVLAILFTLGVGPANSASEPGTVTIVLDLEPASLDPGNTSDSAVARVSKNNILETLTDISRADGSIIPVLATSWKQVDATTWHFFLRRGVKFHDGEDFNADAITFNVKRLFDQIAGNRTRNKFFSSFKMEVKALDTYTVEFRTDKLQPLLPTLMTFMSICSPNTPLDKVIRNPIGTGPYKLTRWDAGMQIVMERFDGYWGKQPEVKKAIYIWRNESSVRAAMVEIGEADIAPNIAIQDAKRSDLDYSYPNSETSFLRIIGIWEPPLNDKRVRMALNLAIDRNAIRGSIFSKDVIPATQVIGPSAFGFNPDLKVWPYDPQKAKQLIDEARRDGVPVDKEISVIGRIAHFPNSGEMMEAVTSMLRAAGFNAKLRLLELSVALRYKDKPFPKIGPYLMLIQHDNVTDAVFSAFYFQCESPSGNVCDKKLDEVIEKAQVAMGNERKTLWQAAFKRIHEEVIPDVVLFHMVGYSRVGKRINFKPTVATNNEVPLAQITFKQ
jgi:peptide/nickel transport system substrate-binding protein